MLNRPLIIVFIFASTSFLQACQDRCTDHPGADTRDFMGDGGAAPGEGRLPPADDLFNGIGWPCDSDADCNPGTYCDESERYCTAPCERTSECEAQFGGFTHCRESGSCAADCGRDEECHAFMLCNTATNYCYRAGTF